ncbi:MAG: tRNA (adenosine(37)-N6)-threonylcarbamoyltransferase complex transferase subunit TsaD [Patescibacteria group bacterium]|nr:tRNA (adenosine(37)-N6)-threonylcarbamoyltransferase complex transferase subunit TsaD [Patescibacteria group bacterium]
MGKELAKQKEIKILGIETSCDETSVALLTVRNGNISKHNQILSNKTKSVVRRAQLDPSSQFEVRLVKHYIATQIPIHARYGGVVPEVAARTHVAELVSLLDKTLSLSSSHVVRPNRPTSKVDFDAIAVTQGPGLATALRVGIEAGKVLAWSLDKPLIAVNHLEGHLASAWLEPANRKNWEFPILFLLVSGGHTELVLMTDFGKYKILSRTRDDAAGEAFDKTAKMLGLEYPGGPKLSKLAEEGNPTAYDLPRPMIHDASLDFSFSGLKTAVRVLLQERFMIKDKGLKIKPTQLNDLCASIQAAIVEVLVAKTVKAALQSKPKAFAVVGGVSANKMLQVELKSALRKKCPEIKFLKPAKGLHTDNGAMIAAAGLWNIIANKKLPKWEKVDAKPELDL